MRTLTMVILSLSAFYSVKIKLLVNKSKLDLAPVIILLQLKVCCLLFWSCTVAQFAGSSVAFFLFSSDSSISRMKPEEPPWFETSLQLSVRLS
jgi:hypothetical protein